MTDDVSKDFAKVADALREEHALELREIEAEALALLAMTKQGADDEKRASILGRLSKRNV